MVLPGLGGDRFSETAEGVSRCHVPRGVFRRHRGEFVFLSSPDPFADGPSGSRRVRTTDTLPSSGAGSPMNGMRLSRMSKQSRRVWTCSPASATSAPCWCSFRGRSSSRHAEDTYVTTNNHNLGKAVVNAFELTAFLSGQPVRAPEHLASRYPVLKQLAMHPVHPGQTSRGDLP